jgi:hypothetical protein
MPQHKFSRRQSNGDFDVITGPSGPSRLPAPSPLPSEATPLAMPNRPPAATPPGLAPRQHEDA